MLRSRLFLLGMIFLFAGAALSGSESPKPIGRTSGDFQLDVREYQLDNGLKILLLEKHDAPVAAYYTFYKVGSRNEHQGITGLSHFIEHMMFNGAKKYGPKMFDLTLERNGGYSNAYTSQNITAYFQVFSSDILETVFDLEGDRMKYIAFKPEMVASEKGVVREERLVTTDNDNVGLLDEELYAAAFKAHSYGWPILGWMVDIEDFSSEECIKYHRMYYAPNNAVLVIAGDFKGDQAYKWAEQYLGDVPSGPPPEPVLRNEPEQQGPRQIILSKPAQHAHFMRGYHVGDKDSPDLYAMDIVQSILTGGESCRLYQTLVNDLEIAYELYGGFEWGFDPSLFYFYVAAVPEQDYRTVEHAFDSVLTEFVTHGPTEKEMTRAKNGLVAQFYRNFKTVEGSAHQLGYFQTLYGDWRTMYTYVENIKKVTPDEVRQAAARYFTVNNSTTAILIPEGEAR